MWAWVCTAARNRDKVHEQALGFATLPTQVLNLTKQNCKPERLFVDFVAIACSSTRTVPRYCFANGWTGGRPLLRSETAAVGGRTKGTRLEAMPEDETDEDGWMDVAHGACPRT